MIRKIIEFIMGFGISIIFGWVINQIIVTTNTHFNSYITNGSFNIIVSLLTYFFLRKRYHYVAWGVLIGTGLLIVLIFLVYTINQPYWG